MTHDNEQCRHSGRGPCFTGNSVARIRVTVRSVCELAEQRFLLRSLAGSPSSGNSSSATKTPKQTSPTQTTSGSTVNTKASGSSSTSVPASARKANSAANAKVGNSAPASADADSTEGQSADSLKSDGSIAGVSLPPANSQAGASVQRPPPASSKQSDTTANSSTPPEGVIDILATVSKSSNTTRSQSQQTGVSRFVLRRRHRHSFRPGECLVPIRSIVDWVQTTVKRTVSAEWHKRHQQHVRVAGLWVRSSERTIADRQVSI